MMADGYMRKGTDMTKDTNRIAGIGERIRVRLTLIEEALGMTPADPEIYSKFIASKAPEPDLSQEEVEAVEGIGQPEDQATVFPRTEDGVPFCWDYQIKGFFKDACSSLRRVPGTRSSKLTALRRSSTAPSLSAPASSLSSCPRVHPAGAASARCVPARPWASASPLPRPRPSRLAPPSTSRCW